MKNVLDLFCGAGGMSEGFSKAGYNIIAGVDNWDDALQTFRDNHGSVGLQRDLQQTHPSELPISKRQVEVVVGGPPCKGFSLAGERNPDDDRNRLVRVFLDYVDYFDPDDVVMENVTGIRSMELPSIDKSVAEYVTDELSEMGYNVEYQTLDATDYGIPQTRKRVFFIGRKHKQPTFPDPFTSERTQSVGPYLNRDDLDEYPNHTYTNHQDSTIEKMSNIDFGESVYDSYSEAWKRLDPQKPAHTIKENHNAPFVHPWEDRVGTPRECAIIQTFYNHYEFAGPKSSVLKQIGNAVPPKLAYQVGKNLLS